MAEERVCAVLESLPGDHMVFRNVYVPCGRGGRTSEVDAVVVSAKGLALVEVKGWLRRSSRERAQL